MTSSRPPPAEALTAFARAGLRHAFLTADGGITGGNFLVAETGEVLLVTNEGNGRLTSSAPRVHIALVGIEKVIPRRADLAGSGDGAAHAFGRRGMRGHDIGIV